ncbi:MAG: hypothetical protein K6A30_01375 [Lachnospiraceae bacterium]|nr:hypothetical protein [Lachnospiraceae bacterium]
MSFELRKYTHPDFTEKKFVDAPNCKLEEAPADGVVPFDFHALSIFPEYFKIDGEWLMCEESRMDTVPMFDGKKIRSIEARRAKKGDLIVVGRTENCEDGIYMHADGFNEKSTSGDTFAFRTGRSRETSFSKDFDEIVELLKYEKDHGHIVWVMGPAFSFDIRARKALSAMIENGYAHAVLAGNALATHDIEGAYMNTALGQNIYTQENVHNGHYNHLDVINRVRAAGSIPAFIEQEHLDNGIITAAVKNNVPIVLGGSIRDDGPLPEVYGNVYAAQDAMREQVSKATTVITMATMLHSIAVGNMTPSFRVTEDGTVRQTYFYVCDAAEFVVNKLADRGSLSSKGIITNAQDFVCNIADGLGLEY